MSEMTDIPFSKWLIFPLVLVDISCVQLLLWVILVADSHPIHGLYTCHPLMLTLAPMRFGASYLWRGFGSKYEVLVLGDRGSDPFAIWIQDSSSSSYVAVSVYSWGILWATTLCKQITKGIGRRKLSMESRATQGRKVGRSALTKLIFL